MWQKISEEPYRAGFRRMLKRVFRLTNGETYDFDIKDEGPAVAMLALTEDRQVILTQQFRPGPEKVFDELPGGKIESGETAEDAAARELLEETGYVGTVEYVGTCYDDAYSTMIRHCFVIKNCKKMQLQQLDPREEIKVVFKSIDAFRHVLRSGEMTDVEVGYLCLDYLDLL